MQPCIDMSVSTLTTMWRHMPHASAVFQVASWHHVGSTVTSVQHKNQNPVGHETCCIAEHSLTAYQT